MLEIEEHEIAARRFQDMADAGGGEFDDEMPEFRVPAAGELLETLRHDASCSWLIDFLHL
jgi:hypothetical protein